LTSPDAGPLDRPPGPPRLGAAGAWAIAVAGLAATVVAFVVALDGARGHDAELVAIARAFAVALPVAVGLQWWRRGQARRYAALLILIGFVAAVVALAESRDPIPYSAGRVAGWFAEALLIAAFLAFPGGTFPRRRDRALALAVAGLVLVLYLPSAFTTDAFPVPAPTTSCVTGCPENAFQLVDNAAVDDALTAVREVATVLLMLLVAFVLIGRLRAATRLARLTMSPIVVLAVTQVVALAALFALRAADASDGLVSAFGWGVFLGAPGLALAVVAAEVRRRQFVATALERLAVDLPNHATAVALRKGMATSLEDPGLRMLFWAGTGNGHWVDESGWPVEAPDAVSAGVTEIHSGPQRVAAILHDPWLAEDPALIAAASSYALVVLENERLVTDLRTSLDELAQSRARVVAAADGERQRLERDLHDGAQQRLVGLRIQLELAAGRLRRVLPRESDALLELGAGVDATIDEVRSIATGVYPAVLAEQGLEEALRSAARRAPLAAGVTAHGLRRWSPEIETTVYFACVEALQNAGKHAAGASGVAILLEGHDGRLRFEVRDDGVGFSVASNGHGAGLVNMRDRVSALGGELAIITSPGHGTRVVGSVPVD
jgi:signal transduction histidine kinase